jgi:hypothetical protein
LVVEEAVVLVLEVAVPEVDKAEHIMVELMLLAVGLDNQVLITDKPAVVEVVVE